MQGSGFCNTGRVSLVHPKCPRRAGWEGNDSSVASKIPGELQELWKQDDEALIEEDSKDVTSCQLWTGWLISILLETMEKLDVRFSDVHLITDSSVLQEQTYIINHIFHFPSLQVCLIKDSYGHRTDP